MKTLTDALIVSDGKTITISNLKFKTRRRNTITDRQVRAYERAHEHIDGQPHMTLSPEKDGKPWRGDTRERPQTPRLLTAREAHRQGFHAGARWGRQDEQRQAKKRRKS